MKASLQGARQGLPLQCPAGPLWDLSDDCAADAARLALLLPSLPGGRNAHYILMYSAMAGSADRDRAIAAAGKLSAKSLDDGMSRTYLLAWLLSVKTA